MKKKIISTVVIASLFTTSLFVSCKKNDNNSAIPTQTAHVNMRLTDAPADYDAVYIDIQKVEVTMEGSAAIQLTPVRPGVYDILKLKNSLDTLLIRADIPAGKISQIRLILGSNNSVVVDGTTYTLNTPSAQESGLKLKLNTQLVVGGSYDMWLDFDVAKSIVATGSGKYNLKPVVTAFAAETDGRIKGYVLPGAALTTVYASNGIDTYSAIPDIDGFFVFKGLPEGTYSVTFDASVVTYTDITITNINVKYGSITDVGTTILK
ncbi:MAG: DUF4382 domain-containing protein [Bacteroidetes bacterium]|nr:DUF4382 domain-containing protein [Bacteroidota bacterium]